MYQSGIKEKQMSDQIINGGPKHGGSPYPPIGGTVESEQLYMNGLDQGIALGTHDVAKQVFSLSIWGFIRARRAWRIGVRAAKLKAAKDLAQYLAESKAKREGVLNAK